MKYWVVPQKVTSHTLVVNPVLIAAFCWRRFKKLIAPDLALTYLGCPFADISFILVDISSTRNKL